MTWRERIEARKEADAKVWRAHLEAMDAGMYNRADRLARRALGVHREAPPMSEETKAKLKSPEYRERAKLKRAAKRLERQALREKVKSLVRKGKRIRRGVLRVG